MKSCSANSLVLEGMRLCLLSTETCLLCGTAYRGDQLHYGMCQNCRDELKHEPGPFGFRVEELEVLAARVFSGITADSIAVWKSGGYKQIGAYLAGTLLAPLIPQVLENTMSVAPVLVPIPALHKNRRRRGFDQAVLLAQYLAGVANWDVEMPIERRGRVAQKTLNRFYRQQNAGSAFVTDASKARETGARNKPVVLVDDVLTTGATARRCAELMQPYSTVAVSVIVLATKI